MSIIATAVRHLMSAGVTEDALLTAIAELEAEVRAEPKPRSSAAIRQERYRRNKASRVTVSDGCDAPSLSLPPNENNSNPPTHTHPDNNTRARKGTGAPAKPEGVSDQTWQDFADLRKRKRAPITPTVIAGIESEARKVGWTMEAALAKCVTRGWQGFEAGWVQGEAPPVTPGAPANDPLMRSIMAMKAREATG